MANMNDFNRQCLEAHNKRRRRHKVPDLVYSDELHKRAQAWADKIATKGGMQHSTDREGKIGENVAMKFSTGNVVFTGEDATEQWYSEIKDYNFKKENQVNCGHFTQVVWKATKECGFGIAKAKDGAIFVVGQYRPAGNLMNTFEENVTPIEIEDQSEPQKKVSQDSTNQETTQAPNDSQNDKADEKEDNKDNVDEKAKEDAKGENKEDTTEDNKKQEEVNIDEGGKQNNEPEASPQENGDKVCEDNQPQSSMPAVADEEKVEENKVETTESAIKADEEKPEKNGVEANGAPDAEPAEQNGNWHEEPEMDEFMQHCLKAHNVYRAAHGAPPLVLNKELSDIAQKWANHLVESGSSDHSYNKFKKSQLGENIAACTYGAPVPIHKKAQHVCDHFYSEIKDYDYGSNPDYRVTGHFSQLVWKGSEELGIGRAIDSNNREVTVCNYYPAGNRRNHYQENVGKPSK